MFIMWRNRFAKLVNDNSFFCSFLLISHIATPNIVYLLNHVIKVKNPNCLRPKLGQPQKKINVN